jgi:hypothetical protein
MILKRIIENEGRLLIFVGFVAGVMLIRIAITFNINWDEFNYLSDVYSFLGGTLGVQLQTIHVHAFSWLPAISANESNQIIAARLVMLLLHGFTSLIIYRIAARATDHTSALFATLAYLSLSYVIRSGTSFRPDPISIFLIAAAFDLVFLRKPDMLRAAAGGILFGIAGMVTIKSAIFLPSFLFLLALPVFGERKAGQATGSFVVGVLSTVVAFVGFFSLHSMSLAESTPDFTRDLVTMSFDKTLRDSVFFPRLSYFLTTLQNDLVIWLFLIAGIVLTLVKIPHSSCEERRNGLALLALAAPLGSLLFYRNAYPYFYGFLLALPVVLIAVSWQALDSRRLTGGTGLVVPIFKLFATLYLLLNLIIQGIIFPYAKPLKHQRQILQTVHRMFERPVPYFSRTAFIATFPKAGFFMSTWGMDSYLANGKRVFAQAIAEVKPPLLIADHPLLDLENTLYPLNSNYGYKLFEEDREVLNATYIHHWGPIYVAGLRTRITGHGTIQIMIGGRYTLEADRSILIDGRRVAPGESIDLARGSHELTAYQEPADITLRWGDKLYRPDFPPPALPLFLGF